MIALLPWLLFVLCVAFDHFKREWESDAAYKELRRQNALQYECLFPDDPCLVDNLEFGMECDNCVRSYKKLSFRRSK